MSTRELTTSLLLLSSVCLIMMLGCGGSLDQQHSSKITIPATDFSLLNRMQGHWRDSQMEEARIEIVGKRMLWVFQDDVMTEKTIEVYEFLPKICFGDPRPDGKGFFVAYEREEGFCYQIVDMHDDIFDYYPIGPVRK